MASFGRWVAFGGAVFGALVGLGIIITTAILSSPDFIQYGKNDWRSFFQLGEGARYSIFYFGTGVYFILWGFAGMLGSYRLKTNPRMGVIWLLLSVVGSGSFALNFALWGISPVIEIIGLGLFWLGRMTTETNRV